MANVWNTTPRISAAEHERRSSLSTKCCTRTGSNYGAPGKDEHEQGGLADRFKFVEAKEEEDDGADPPHKGPIDLERGMIAAKDGEGKDTVNPHGRTKTNEQAIPAQAWITKPIMERTKNL